MSDHDRRLADIEKRLARVERLFDERHAIEADQKRVTSEKLHSMYGEAYKRLAGWCECGRDVCRAPDCPSHRTDPLGR
jgi:hypothetical protein